MNHQRRIAIWLLAAFVAGCDHKIQVIEEVASPDREHKAVVFTSQAGGVASDLHTSVSVIPARKSKPGWPPNVFTATHGGEPTPAGPFFGPKLSVRWVAEDTVEITHDPRVSTLRKHAEVKGVHVRYRVVPQDSAARADSLAGKVP